jgi:hypothetical protein
MADSTPVTEWDAQGNPIPSAPAQPQAQAQAQGQPQAQPQAPAPQVTEWDAQGTPIPQQPKWIDNTGASTGGDAVRGVAKGFADIGSAFVPDWHSVGDALWSVAGLVPGVKQIHAETIPAIQAFMAAHSKGASLVDSAKAAESAARQHNELLQTVNQRMDEFRKSPTQASARTLVDLVPIVASAFGLRGALPEEAGATEAAGAGGAGADSAAATEGAPRAGSATDLQARQKLVDALLEGRDTNPIDLTVRKALNEIGISKAPMGSSPTPNMEMAEAGLQNNFHGGIHDIAVQAAKDAGVGYEETGSIRDVVGATARAVLKNAQADFKTLDEASGGRWQRFDEQIKNVQNKMSEVSGIDDEAYENLESRRNELQTLQAQMVEDMKEGGKVDPAIADRAVAQYKKGMALQDLSNAVRTATKRAPAPAFSGPPVRQGIGPVTTDNPVFSRGLGESGLSEMVDKVDPNMLANRLSKLNDVPLKGGASRLEQALGKEGAQNLIDHVDSGQLAFKELKDFVPQTEVGRKALDTLLRQNATVKSPTLFRPESGQIDYTAAVRDFENMGNSKQFQVFGGETPKVRKALYSRAQQQNAIQAIKKYAPWLGGLGAAGAGEEVVRRTFGSSDEK